MRWGRRGLLSGVHDDCARRFFSSSWASLVFDLPTSTPTPSSHASTHAFCCTKKSSTATLSWEENGRLLAFCLRFPALSCPVQSIDLPACYIHTYIHATFFLSALDFVYLLLLCLLRFFFTIVSYHSFLRWSYIL